MAVEIVSALPALGVLLATLLLQLMWKDMGKYVEEESHWPPTLQQAKAKARKEEKFN